MQKGTVLRIIKFGLAHCPQSWIVCIPRYVGKYNARMSDKEDLRDLENAELRFVPVSIQQLARAVTQVESCEKCNPDAETINRDLAVLRIMLNKARAWKYEVAQLRIRLLKGEKHRQRIMTKAEEIAYLALASELLRDFANPRLEHGYAARFGNLRTALGVRRFWARMHLRGERQDGECTAANSDGRLGVWIDPMEYQRFHKARLGTKAVQSA